MTSFYAFAVCAFRAATMSTHASPTPAHTHAHIKVQKRDLRRKVRGKLKELSSHEIDVQSLKVFETLRSLPVYQEAKTVAIFVNMPHEIDTNPIIHDAFKHKKRCYFPVVTCKEKHEMKLISATSEHDITTWGANNWNIPEPPVNDPSRSDALNDANISLDLIIMPGVAFDPKCARLGQGMGFYDKLICEYHNVYAERNLPRVRTIGIGLHEQLVSEVPMDSLDQYLDMVVVPQGIFKPRHERHSQ